LINLVVFMLGLSIGSFVNACVYRIPRGVSVITPRSFCPSCKATLRWYELVPILSYLFLGRKCRSCGTAISVCYLILEFTSGVIFLSLLNIYGMTTDLITASAFSTLLLIVFLIDGEALLIPNGVVIIGIVIGVLLNLCFSFDHLLSSVGSALFASLLMFLIRLGGNVLFRKETMGMGDVKVSALIGLFIGMQDFLLAVWAAAIAGCLYWLIRHFIMHSPKDIRLPFGSFLALSSFVVFLFSDKINEVLLWWLTF